MFFRALIFRPLRNDAGRTLLSLLAIALGVAVVVAIRIANRSAVASFQQTTQTLAGGADLLVTGPQPLPASLLPRLAPLAGQAEILPYLDRRAYDPRAKAVVEVLGVDLLAAGAAAESGPLADSARARPAPPVPLDLIVAGSLRRVQPAARLAGGVLVLDLPDALGLFEPGQPPSFDGLRVTLAPGAASGAVTRALAALLPAVDRAAPPAVRVQQSAQMLAAFRANLEALSYVSLLVGIFLIYNTVSISVVRRRVAIATVRALGATRAQVLRLFLAEGLVLSLLGGLLGLFLGWLLAAAALQLVTRTVNNLYAAVAPVAATLRPADLAWALLLAAGAGLLAAWAPARHAARVPPAQALRPGSEEGAARARSGWLGAGAVALAAAAVVLAHLPEPGNVPLWGFASALAAVLAWACLTPLLLAAALPRLRRSFLRRGRLSASLAAGSLAGALRRTAVLVVALATALGVLLGVAIMVGSFRRTVQVWIGQQLQADVFLRAADWERDRPAPLAPALIAAAASTPAAVAVEASHTQAWEFRGQPIALNTRWWLRGSAAGAARQFLAGGATPGAVIVSEPFARRFHLWTGDALPLDTPSGPVRLAISGVFYDYSSDRGIVVLDPSAFARAFGPPAITELALYAAPAPASTASLLQAVQLRTLPWSSGVDIHDNASLRREAMRVFDQTFRITYALEAITLLVAILGVANTLLAVVLERAREFAILRILGATRRQVRAILVSEAALVATLALALGWGIAAVLAIVLVRVINVQSFGWTIQFHLPFAFLLPASALVWLATVAAGALPARAALRQAAASEVGAE